MHFLRRLVVGEAARLERGYAGAVLAPLVLPEGLAGAVVRQPVRLHVREQVVVAERLQDRGDVGVGAAAVARRVVRTVAVVRPQPVDRPAVVRSDRGVRVPELRLQERTPRVVEAAQVGDCRRVVARELVRARARLRVAS